MSLNTVLVELSIAGVWTDVTAYVLTEPRITIRHGASAESGTSDPSECQLSFNNADGRFTPDNPVGPYYGNIGRNTPLRVTVNTDVRFIGEVSEFPSEWDPAGKMVVTRCVASGPLRRLVKGTSTTSVLRDHMVGRSESLQNIAAYWPLEDGPGATSFVSAIGGTPLGRAQTGLGFPTPQGYNPSDAFMASAPIATFDTSPLAGSVPDYTFTGSATYGLLIHVPDAGSTNSPAILQVMGQGTADKWELRRIADSVSGNLRLVASGFVGTARAELLNTNLFNLPAGSTHYVYLELTNNGANVDWYVTALGLAGVGGTLVGYNVGKATSVYVGGQNLNPDGAFDLQDGWGLGHVIIGTTDATLDSSAALEDPLLGYTTNAAYANADGESIVERLTRLAGVAGVDIATVDGTTTDRKPMGMDAPGGVLERMRRAEAADVGGILHDNIDVLGLRYVTRSGLHSDVQAPAFELDYTAGHISPPLRPTDDDATLINDAYVTAENASTERVTVTDGPLNVEPYPDGVGRYEDARTLALSYTEDPIHYAGWIVNVGTVDGQRFTAVTVDLRANLSLAGTVTDLRPGDWIKLTNLPSWLPPVDPELIVRGWSETIGAATHAVTFNCAPAAPYRVFEIESQTYGRLDSDTTTISEPLDATETDVDYTGDTWVTTATRPQDFPFDVVIGGEVMRVTAATGTTFTVTRSMNGVVKAHGWGSPVRLAYPVHLAL